MNNCYFLDVDADFISSQRYEAEGLNVMRMVVGSSRSRPSWFPSVKGKRGVQGDGSLSPRKQVFVGSSPP
jgi:hypothetical protein